MTLDLLRLVFKSYPLAILGLLSLALFNAVLEGTGMSLLLPILEGLNSPDHIEPTHPLSQIVHGFLTFLNLPFTLWVLFICGVSLVLIQAFVTYIRINLVAGTGAKVVFDIRQTLFTSLLHSGINYFYRKKLGDLTNSVITEADRARAAFQHLMNVLVECLLIGAYLSLAFIISLELSITLLLLTVPLLGFVGKRKKIYNHGGKLTEANDSLQSRTVECFLGIREIILLGLKDYMIQSFNSSSQHVSSQTWLLQRLTARFGVGYEVAAVVILISVVGLAFFTFHVPGTEIVVFLAILLRLTPRITSLQKYADAYLANLPGFEVIKKARQEADHNRIFLTNSKDVKFKFQSFIKFCNVSFSHDGYEKHALENINLSFPKGKTTAIVGASGAGKSTLIDLMVRLYDPTEGKIIIDDQELKCIDLEEWRASIGLVSQDTFLFNDSVMENIRFGSLDATQNDVETAAKNAYAHEFILELPGGYQTKVGDRGVKLSGGQKQRLALARALLRKPQILILDEATSDLDSKSEHFIQDSLRNIRLHHTVIIVAHRLSTIENADEIIVLGEGRVLEVGGHDSLVQKGKHYAEFYNIQKGHTSIVSPGVPKTIDFVDE